MKTRIIHTKFWTDGYISSLSRAEKLAFVYLITNEHIGLSGIYELPDNRVTFEIGLTQTEWEEIKQKFSNDQKFNFYKGWVKINNIDKYQQFSGEKNIVAKNREIDLISKEVLDTLSIPYRYPIGEKNTIEDSLSNHKSVISNKKSIKEINEEDFKEISEKYNVPVSFVRSKYDDMVNWSESNGKVKRDWIATLRNWVKKDAMQLRKDERVGKKRITFIDPS